MRMLSSLKGILRRTSMPKMELVSIITHFMITLQVSQSTLLQDLELYFRRALLA